MKWVHTELKKPNSGRWAARFKLPIMDEGIPPSEYVNVTRHQRQVHDWCVANFGKHYASHPIKYRWYMDGWTAHFRNEDDAFAFKMRWC